MVFVPEDEHRSWLVAHRVRRAFARQMKSSPLFLLLVGALFFSVFDRPAHANTTDYALMSATPYNSEIALARERLQKFLYTANAKKRAVVAVARKLAVLLHRLWVTGDVYEPLRHTGAGSRIAPAAAA